MIDFNKQFEESFKTRAMSDLQEIIAMNENRFNYECSLRKREIQENIKRNNKGREQIELYDPDSAEMKTYKAYEWICDHVKLKGAISENSREFSLELVPEVSGDRQMDSFLSERFLEIYENVQRKSKYLVA